VQGYLELAKGGLATGDSQCEARDQRHRSVNVKDYPGKPRRSRSVRVVMDRVEVPGSDRRGNKV